MDSPMQVRNIEHAKCMANRLAAVQREGGASVDEIVAATRLKPHSVRAIISMAKSAPGGPAIEYVRREQRFRLQSLSA